MLHVRTVYDEQAFIELCLSEYTGLVTFSCWYSLVLNNGTFSPQTLHLRFFKMLIRVQSLQIIGKCVMRND
jgi:hypothetical protein